MRRRDDRRPRRKTNDAIRKSNGSFARMARDVARDPEAGEDSAILKDAANRIDDSLQSLAIILEQYDALNLWFAKSFEQLSRDAAQQIGELGPYNPDGLKELSIALWAAFDIGGRVVANPMIERRVARDRAKARQAQTGAGRNARKAESERQNATIKRCAEKILDQKPNLGRHNLAQHIDATEEVNLDVSAIEKRLRKMKLGRPRKRFSDD